MVHQSSASTISMLILNSAFIVDHDLLLWADSASSPSWIQQKQVIYGWAVQKEVTEPVKEVSFARAPLMPLQRRNLRVCRDEARPLDLCPCPVV